MNTFGFIEWGKKDLYEGTDGGGVGEGVSKDMKCLILSVLSASC